MSDDKINPNKIYWRAGIHERLYVNSPISVHNPASPTQSGSISVNNSGNLALAGNISATGNMGVTGSLATTGNLVVTGSTTINGSLTTTGTVTAHIPGQIISYVALDHATEQTYAVTTSAVNIASANQTAVITFTAPSSGNVEIQVQTFIGTVTDQVFVYMALSTAASYAQLDSGAHEHIVFQSDETDDVIIDASWVLTGLTSGTSYTYYIAAKANAASRATLKWGGSGTAWKNQPFIIKATSLPATIVTDN